jgi:hypothetical protein
MRSTNQSNKQNCCHISVNIILTSIYNMIRIEKDDDLRRILESLLKELASRNILERNTIQNIIDEGKRNMIISS